MPSRNLKLNREDGLKQIVVPYIYYNNRFGGKKGSKDTF